MSRGPRRNHTPAFKGKVAIATIKGDRTLAQLAEQFDVHPNQITAWKARTEALYRCPRATEPEPCHRSILSAARHGDHAETFHLPKRKNCPNN